MTNTELIRQEIERRIGAMYNFSEGYSALNTCRELLDFIDKLPKETVTNCHQLEESAEKFARSYDQGTCDGIAQDCFKAGANWQKEQLKEEAIVGEIVDPEYLWRIIGDTPSDILFKRGFRDGDLVRVNVSRLSDNA